jgi:hypothetical protein
MRIKFFSRARALARAERALKRIDAALDRGGWNLNPLNHFRLNFVCGKIRKLEAEMRKKGEIK